MELFGLAFNWLLNTNILGVPILYIFIGISLMGVAMDLALGRKKK